MFTTKEILSQLETFRPVVGHHIHVHSSLKAVGEVEGRGEALLTCLIDFFTQDGGTISFPTHTWDTNVLDLNKTDTCMGMLSKLALQRTDGVRTLNPTHSMIIFGERANAYAKWDENIKSSVSPNGCYGKLYDEDGYVLTKPLHLVYEEFGDISDNFGKLEKAFRYHNCVLDGKIGDAKVQLCSARKMRETLEMIHRKSGNIEIFLDDKALQEEWY